MQTIKVQSKDKKVIRTISKGELPTYLLRGWHEYKETTVTGTATSATAYSTLTAN